MNEITNVTIDREKMAEKLISLRGDRTQKEVSEAVGISPSALAMYETGERAPRDEIKLRLAAYYHTTLQELFFIPKVYEM